MQDDTGTGTRAVHESSPEARIRQKRGQITYDALIETAFALLDHKEFDEISIAELARKAGYSVGAFYARFRSKDELFDAMVMNHLEGRRAVRRKQFEETDNAALIHDVLAETVHYYWGRRRFWRAALIRSIRDPKFWIPIRKLSHEVADSLVARAAASAGRPLAGQEEANVRFAIQLAFGTINNTILNRPGPFFMEQALFVENLVRAFLLVSGFDALSVPTRPKRRSTRGKKAAKGRERHQSQSPPGNARFND
jgi:AcrR family transcriptional regulator